MCWKVEDTVNFEFVAKYLAYFGLKSPTSKDSEAGKWDYTLSTLIRFQSLQTHPAYAPGGLEGCGEKI